MHDILTNPTYAGYAQSPAWGVSLHKGAHDGLVSLRTFERVQERLNGMAKAPARKDISVDFPLRGFIPCDDCHTPMTACWSKSKTGEKHPYYTCKTKGCEVYRKSIRRSRLEEDLLNFLKRSEPSKGLFKVAQAMFRDIWAMNLSRTGEERRQLEAKARELLAQINELLDRIVDAQSAKAAAKLEERVTLMEREKLVIVKQIAGCGKLRNTAGEAYELALRLLPSP